MPRRNLLVLIAVAAVSLLCYQKVSTNRYGRIVVDAMEEIEQRYLEPVEPVELFEGAMEGMVSRLDDYSGFISARNLAKFHEDLDQKFGGVGMEVELDSKTKQLTVMSPLVGTPAYEAGIQAGDRILRIDDRSTQGMSLNDAVALMRGEVDEPVTLTVLRAGEPDPIEITLVRAIIKIDTVVGDVRNADGSWDFFLDKSDEVTHRIGYVRINTFAENTADELRKALELLVDDGMQGLIVDLRDDPGGWLRAATAACDLFIDSGVIVTTRGRDRQVRDAYKAGKKGTFGDFPMAVLVNHFSASASEIVAACLQDHDRAVIVGQRTWGKGTVQEVLTLEGEEGALKLTTASYWRPSGKNIHKTKQAEAENAWGVSPDEGYEVIVEDEELTKLRLWRHRRDAPPGARPEDAEDPQEPFVDRQLGAAVEYLEAQLEGKK